MAVQSWQLISGLNDRDRVYLNERACWWPFPGRPALSTPVLHRPGLLVCFFSSPNFLAASFFQASIAGLPWLTSWPIFSLALRSFGSYS
jgi:hypothetical protein